MDNFLGELRLFAGNFAPRDWALCDGSMLSISDYSALYALLGTTYGGDGVSTFGVPDLRGRVPVGQGSGNGLTPRTLGETGGEEAHTLKSTEIPAHSHPAGVTDGNATTLTAGPNVGYATVTPNGDTYRLYTSLTPPAVKPHTMNINAVGMAGGGQSHDNTMLTMPINYIIALYGIYPTPG